MINQIKLENFGPLSRIEWSGLGKINLITGGNGSGKTFLLGRWGDIEVPDPHRQQRIAFEHVYGLMEQSVARWANYIS